MGGPGNEADSASAGDPGHGQFGASPVHGQQEGSSYNGHFESTCYHPLFVFNQFGDCEGAKLRAGKVHSAHKWRDVLEPILSRYEETGVRRYFRADAAFAKPDIYEYLEERRDLLRNAAAEQRCAATGDCSPADTTWLGRPPKRPVVLYDDKVDRAGSWTPCTTGGVPKVDCIGKSCSHGLRLDRHDMTAGTPEGVVRFYNGRGTAEPGSRIAPEVRANWTRLSCHRFVANVGCANRVSVGFWRTRLGNGTSAAVSAPKDGHLQHWSFCGAYCGPADQDGRPAGAARAR